MALDVAGLHAEASTAYEWLAAHPARRRSVAQLLLPRRRQRRGGQARHQRVCLRRDRRVAPLAVHWIGPSSTSCGRRSTERSTGCSSSVARRARAVGVEADGAAVGLRPARRHVEHLSLRCVCGARGWRPPARRRDWAGGRRDVPPWSSSPPAPSSRRSAGRWTGTTGCSRGAHGRGGQGPSRRRLVHVRDGGLGVRCVSDEPWVTASETADAPSPSPIGDSPHRRRLSGGPRAHRRDDGSYWTGIVYPPAARRWVPVRRVHVVHGCGGDPRRRRDHRSVARLRTLRPRLLD